MYDVMPCHASSAVLEDASAPFPQFCVVGSSSFLEAVMTEAVLVSLVTPLLSGH